MPAGLRAALIVGAAVLVTGAMGIGLTKRLMHGIVPEAPVAAGGVLPLYSGRGVVVEMAATPAPLPAFDARDMDGRLLPREAWRGKVVILNVWATWCGPCRIEIPDLIALQTRYRDHLVVVGLSIDEGPTAVVRQFAEAQQMNYPVALIDREAQRALGGIASVPSTFVLNREGQVAIAHVGLLDAARTEHEVRVLAGLPTPARIQPLAAGGH